MAKIGYVRTSTNKQYTDRQINELKRYCDKIYVEDGVSAARRIDLFIEKLLLN